MPPNEATEIIASPEPQIASIRRTYGATTVCLSTMIGASTTPAFAGDFSLSFTAGLSFGEGGDGVLDLAVGDVELADGPAAGVPGPGAG